MSEANASQPVPTVNLGAHIADEYGLPPVTAREVVRYGTVVIDGDKFDGDPELVPVEDLEGKNVVIEHDLRRFAFVYRQPLSQRLG